MSSSEKPVKDRDDFSKGPLNVLHQCMDGNLVVAVKCRNDKTLVGRIKAFDRHWNMILQEVTEMWVQPAKVGKGQKKGKAIAKDRYIPKMFLRGDSVIAVVKAPVT